MTVEDETIFNRIIKSYADNDEDISRYSKLSVGEKLKLVRDWKKVRERLKSNQSRKASTYSIRPNLEIKTDEVKPEQYLSRDDENFFEIVVDRLSKGQERPDQHRKLLVALPLEQKKTLLSQYRLNMNSSFGQRRSRSNTALKTETSRSLIKGRSNSDSPEKSSPTKGFTLSMSNLFASKSENLEEWTRPKSRPQPRPISQDVIQKSPEKSPELKITTMIKKQIDTESKEFVYALLVDKESGGSSQIRQLLQNKPQKDKDDMIAKFFQNFESLKANCVELDQDAKLNYIVAAAEPAIAYSLWKHCVREHSEEVFLFLLEFSRMDDVISEEMTHAFDDIYATYIAVKAPKELNLPGSVRAYMTHQTRNHKKGCWEYQISPKQMLLEVHATCVHDLRDPTPRYMNSAEGIRVLSNFMKNSNIISSNPMDMVKYKLAKSMNVTNLQKEVDELARHLSDPAEIVKNYLSLEWQSVLACETKLNSWIKRRKSDTNEEEEEKGAIERSLLAHKQIMTKVLKLKLVIMTSRKQSFSESAFSRLLSPILQSDGVSSKQPRFGLIVGPWIMMFEDDELCVPKRYFSVQEFFCVDLDEIYCENKFDEYMTKIGTVIAYWNARKDFCSRERNTKTHSDSLDFIEDVLKALGSRMTTNDDTIQEIIRLFSSLEKENLVMTLSTPFQEKFKLVGTDSYEFKSHAELDDFCTKLIDIEPLFDQNIAKEYPLFDPIFLKEYIILKAFDRIFWMKSMFYQGEIDRTNLKLNSIEDFLEEKALMGDPTEHFDFYIQEQISFEIQLEKLSREMQHTRPHNCCFDDPTASKSLIL